MVCYIFTRYWFKIHTHLFLFFVFNLYICWYILFYFVQWNLGTPTWLNKMDKYRRGSFQDVTRFFYAIPKLNHYYRSKTLSHWYCSVLEVFNKYTSSALHKKIFHSCCYWFLVCLQCIYFVVEEVSGQLAVYNLMINSVQVRSEFGKLAYTAICMRNVYTLIW
jgi:hypothetical protein